MMYMLGAPSSPLQSEAPILLAKWKGKGVTQILRGDIGMKVIASLNQVE